MRTAWLSRCQFQWAYHEPLALKVGVTPEEIRRLIDGPEAPGWDEDDATLLRVVDELDAQSGLSDATWALLGARFDDSTAWRRPSKIVKLSGVPGGEQRIRCWSSR